MAKRLPVEFLEGIGLSDFTYVGRPAVRIPYVDVDGVEVAVRFRIGLVKGERGDDRFRWRKGSKPLLYGLWRLSEARAKGYVYADWDQALMNAIRDDWAKLRGANGSRHPALGTEDIFAGAR